MSVARTSINILISVLFASMFLIIFFFTYVKKLEEKVIINNVKFTIDSLLDGILPFIPPENKKSIYNFINSLNLTVDKNADIATENSNNKLLVLSIFAITILATIVIVIIGVIYALNVKSLKPVLPEIATENLIIVSFIGLTELVFLNIFASKYISANPNIITYNLLNITKLKKTSGGH